MKTKDRGIVNKEIFRAGSWEKAKPLKFKIVLSILDPFFSLEKNQQR